MFDCLCSVSPSVTSIKSSGERANETPRGNQISVNSNEIKSAVMRSRSLNPVDHPLICVGTDKMEAQ